MPTADRALLVRWTERADAEAFAELVRRHAAMVHAVCRRIVKDAALADDLTQDCFLSLSEQRPAPARNLAGWLHRVATNRALSALRAPRATESAAEPVERSTPESLASWCEVEVHVDRAIADLPEAQRNLVVAHFLEGLSHRELARSHGIGHRTVGYRIERGIDAVRENLRRRGVHVERFAFCSWLGALPRDGIPATLIASLGKTALAGPAGVMSSVPLGVATAVGAAKTVVVGVAAVALLAAVGTWIALSSSAHDAQPAASVESASAVADHESDGVTETVREPRVAVVDDVDVTTAGMMFAGVVLDAERRPVGGARVFYVELDDPYGANILEPSQFEPSRIARTTSDASGRFSVARQGRSRSSMACAFFDGMVGERTFDAGATEGDVVLVLAPGRTFRGRVYGPDGATLPDAVVALSQCWSRSDFAKGSGMAVTDANGEFELGVAADSIACTVRVNSSEHGQDFFIGVSTESYADLHWQPRAMFHGRVSGLTSERMGQLFVDVVASLPDIPVPVWRTGSSPQIRFSAEVAADGSYAVADIQPGLVCGASLVAIGVVDERRHRLAPDTLDWLTLAPEQVVERDFELVEPIAVRGRVRTSKTARPVADARIEVTHDGETLWDATVMTDTDGRYALQLNGGTGTYRIRALPRTWVGNSRSAEGGVELQLTSGEKAEIDLALPEPVVIPFRVVDARGTAVVSVQTELSIVGEDGRHARIGSSQRLDADGRGRIELFALATSARLSVQRFPVGPRVRASFEGLAAGTDPSELTIRLPEACDIRGTLRDGDDAPVAEQAVTIEARYDDGEKDRTTTMTNRHGGFALDGAFRAAPADVTVWLPDRRRAAARISGSDSDLGVLIAK